jgi:CO/xanthine dehydrogenase Mo-binding subunit
MTAPPTTPPTTVTTVLPGSLNANRRLSQWLAINADGTVTVRTGKVELGQGIATALAQIVCVELGVAASRIRMVAASTTASPNEGVTAGSMSVHDSGGALRQVCAEARAIYLQAAATRFKLSDSDAAFLTVHDGSIQTSNGKLISTYWTLANDTLLACEATGQATSRGAAPTATLQRLDIPDKVTGRPRFVHDMTLPGMLFGRVLHPPSPGATLLGIDLAIVDALPGVVATVRDGSFLGVLAKDEYAAVKALAKLAALASWQEPETLPDMHDLPAFLRGQQHDTMLVGEKKSEPAAGATRPFQASYSRPYIAHASAAPSCAVARYSPKLLEVWTHSQGIFNLRADLAVMLGMAESCVCVNHAEGAGSYGHNGADDAACDAALLARAVPGQAVRLQWTREDELSHAPFGAAMAVDLKADVDAQGRITHWQHDVWSNGHSMRPGRSKIPVLLAASHLAKPYDKQVAINMPLAGGGGSERNSVPTYDFESWRAISHRCLSMPIRTSSLRSLGAHCNVFASESFVDEIATSLDADPLEFRLRHLTDPRAKDVLNAAASLADWHSLRSSTIEGRGVGIAFARYKNTGAWCAVVALMDAGHELRVKNLWIAVDVGRAVHLDGIVNQIEGGAIQAASWTLKEAAQFDRTRITSNTWETYPILRFSEVPAVQVKVIDRPEQKSVGAGEATNGPVSAAIGNAIFNALGVRARHLPFTMDALTQAALAEENP